MKGSSLRLVAALGLVLTALAFGGAYMSLDGDSVNPKEAIKSTSSYGKLSDDDSFRLDSIEIDSELIERSRSMDPSYNQSVLDSEDVMRDSYIVGVDFGKFKEEKGYFYMAETDTVKSFYQVSSEGELVAEMSGYAISQSYMKNKSN